jgi:hypothetical protein
MVEVITERITCRAFDVTITRYIDATMMTFHSVNEKIFVPKLYHSWRNEDGYRMSIIVDRGYRTPIMLDEWIFRFQHPVLSSYEQVVRIEDDRQYIGRLEWCRSLAKIYPAKKDPRPEWL